MQIMDKRMVCGCLLPRVLRQLKLHLLCGDNDDLTDLLEERGFLGVVAPWLERLSCYIVRAHTHLAALAYGVNKLCGVKFAFSIT